MELFEQLAVHELEPSIILVVNIEAGVHADLWPYMMCSKCAQCG